jgi:hypothetical protein
VSARLAAIAVLLLVGLLPPAADASVMGAGDDVGLGTGRRIGTDPEVGGQPGYYLQIVGPNSAKGFTGDRLQAKWCDSDVYGCTAGTPNNAEYDPDGYRFHISVDGPTGRPLVIRAFDPGLVAVGDTCSNAFPTAGQLDYLAGLPPTSTLPAGWYADAHQRYHGHGTTPWCTGDASLGVPADTSFIVRSPDATPDDDLDNPVACDPLTAEPYLPGSDDPKLIQLLDPTDGIADAQAVVDPTDDAIPGGLTFTESWRRWVTLCRVPAGDVVQGDYIVQVRTNAHPGDELVYDPTVATGGRNRFALQATDGTAVAPGVASIRATDTPDGSGEARIAIGPVLPQPVARTLAIELFDVGDDQQPGTITILGPDGRPYAPPGGCTFERSFAPPVISPTCTLTGISRTSGYSDQLVTALVPVPATYTCTPTRPRGCSFGLRLVFPGLDEWLSLSARFLAAVD